MYFISNSWVHKMCPELILFPFLPPFLHLFLPLPLFLPPSFLPKPSLPPPTCIILFKYHNAYYILIFELHQNLHFHQALNVWHCNAKWLLYMSAISLLQVIYTAYLNNAK